MVNRPGGNVNHFDTITSDGEVTLNSSTWTSVLSAGSKRVAVVLTNISASEDIYISLNNSNIHFLLGKGTMIWKPDGVWRGTIHAKSSSGTPKIYFVDFSE